MGLPVVAPALPGNVELLGAGDPRADRAARRRGALRRRARGAGRATPERRAAIGAAHRERALGRAVGARDGATPTARSTTRCSSGAPGARARGPGRRRPAPAALPRRDRAAARRSCRSSSRASTTAATCRECLEPIRAQTWPEIEVIVVDDASTDPDTHEVLDALEAADGVAGDPACERNGGPSRARNAGHRRARAGATCCPSTPTTCCSRTRSSASSSSSPRRGEQVGFVYPNLQYFGTRRDYFEAPPYNLYCAALGNYCDTCSLVDRSVYDAGLRFAEDIVLGHEDWDFALQLAERGILGEPVARPGAALPQAGLHALGRASSTPRRRSTTRSAARHPELFGDDARLGAAAARRRPAGRRSRRAGRPA